MCFSPQRRAIFRLRNVKKCSETVSFLTFWLENVLLATTACNFWRSELQKVVRECSVLYIFTWKCDSRHSFQHLNVKKCSEPLSFSHFHLKMCFSPQRRPIFQHLNFKKWSGADVFCTFWLENVLLATAACNFWFLLWPHDSAPAALTSLLFDSPDTRIIWKTQHFATSLTFGAGVSSFFWLSRYCIFFLLTLLHLICFSSAFQLSKLSEVYYLNFLRQTSDNVRVQSATQSTASVRTYSTHVQTSDNVRNQSATQSTASVRTYFTHVQTCDNVRVQSATQSTASVHTLHMSKPVITFVFKVLRNRLLRCTLYTCPNLW